MLEDLPELPALDATCRVVQPEGGNSYHMALTKKNVNKTGEPDLLATLLEEDLYIYSSDKDDEDTPIFILLCINGRTTFL